MVCEGRLWTVVDDCGRLLRFMDVSLDGVVWISLSSGQGNIKVNNAET